MHTFRRTYVTLLEDLGTPYGTVRKLARHGIRPSDVTARYLLPTQEQLRKALETLASKILGPASIIPLYRQPPVSLAR
jgi:hypothetical protein